MLLLEQLAVVVKLRRFRAGSGGGSVPMRLEHVSHGHDLGTGYGLGLPLLNSALNSIQRFRNKVVHQLHGPPASSDHADSHGIIGPQDLGRGTGRRGGESDKPRSSACAVPEEATPSHWFIV
jgi:hypothetical protein